MAGSIYPVNAPNSAGQRAFTQARLAALAEQRKQRDLLSEATHYVEEGYLERTITINSDKSLNQTATDDGDYGRMDPIARADTSSTRSSSHSEQAHLDLLANPYEIRHGRRYLRSLPYPLPVDLQEIHRQNLRTLLGCRVFGKAVCSPDVSMRVRRVLEVGCGSGYWSAMCHEYLSSLGCKDVAFVGVDIAPIAPDLRKQGVNWTFVQHDIRRMPLPFDDGEFDLIMVKDMSLALPLGLPSQKLLDENIRLLREGGILEIWESDHVLRSLLPHPPPPPSTSSYDDAVANQTATFLIAPSTPFAPAQNKYLQCANSWIQEALDTKRLPPTPCAGISQVLLQEPDALGDIGSRRVAIPLGELRWERQGFRLPVDAYPSSKGKARVDSAQMSDVSLTADQLAIRQTALLSVLQQIESLEPQLRETSGKNTEEWSHWWALMMNDMLDPTKGAVTGECLEMGAWWATRLPDDY